VVLIDYQLIFLSKLERYWCLIMQQQVYKWLYVRKRK
jgi:hypothetical protein